MKPENQVCTLEQAKKLQELGVESESFFKWQQYRFEDDDDKAYTAFGLTCGESNMPLYFKSELFSEHWAEGSIDMMNPIDWNHSRIELWDKVIPAYTVAELGEMNNSMKSYWSRDEFECHHYRTEFVGKGAYEAEARAAMLIYLIENAILSPSKTES